METTLRIAFLSEHASPVALLGGQDAGGQNVYVDEVSRGLGRLGFAVDVFTRRDSPGAPAVVEWAPGVRVVNLAVGPAEEEASLASDISMAEAGGTGAVVIPFMRRPTSDLSTTLAMALVAFIFIEIQGFRANGTHYLGNFFRLSELKKVNKGMMAGLVAVIQFAVGFLELLSELIRIISFSFRLFGNMFAGTILVLVMAFLMPVVVPVAFLALEFAVAVIQAFVFMMLIVVFTSLAVTSHGGDEEHAEAHGH